MDQHKPKNIKKNEDEELRSELLRNVQDLLAEGKSFYERRFGEPIKGSIIPFGAMVECHPISPRDQARVHQFGKKILPGIFLGYELIAERIWKGDILIADLEELENLDASELYPRRINAKEVLIRQKDDEFIFPEADGRKILRIPRTHSEAGTNRKERRSQQRTSRRTGRVSTDRINR